MSEMAESEKIARAVAAQLAGAGLGFAPVYDPNPDCDLKDLTTLAVKVRDLADEFTPASRSMTQHDYSIAVVFQQRFGTNKQTVITSLKYHLQQVAEYYRFRALVGHAARFNRVEDRAVMDDRDAQNRLLMKAYCILIFRAFRS